MFQFDTSAPIILFRLGLIILLAVFFNWGMRLVTARLEKQLERKTYDEHQVRRMRTLMHSALSVSGFGIVLMVIAMALSVLEIDITPLLASVGIVGLALSFGAQTLVRDYLGGVLILVEDQFRVGDVIQVGDKSGEVEHLTLRATYLRDMEGKQHIIPNGEIRVISNVTKKWARAVVELTVDFNADFTNAIRALEAATARLQKDEALTKFLIDAPQLAGWVGFKDWGVQMRLTAKTVSGKQWEVASALRKYATVIAS